VLKADSRERKARDRDILKMYGIDGIDVSRLSDADIKTGAELVRRMTQCDRVPGAGKRRPAAIAAWQAFEARLRGGASS